ncbi:MAG: hypothetical protein ACE5OY_08350 [Candidatus Bathyarchaeia archaeon]
MLEKAILHIIAKFNEAMRVFRDRLRDLGRPLAERMALLTAAWGNIGATDRIR